MEGELAITNTRLFFDGGHQFFEQFNDPGINELFEKLMTTVEKKTGVRYGELTLHSHSKDTTSQSPIMPPSRVRYLSEITGAIREYNRKTDEQSAIASRLYQLQGVLK